MINGIVNQVDIIIINVNVPNNGLKRQEAKLTEMKKEIDRPIILIGYFNNSVQKT